MGDRSRGNSRDRMFVDSAETRTSRHSPNVRAGPPSRKHRGKGGATALEIPTAANPFTFCAKHEEHDRNFPFFISVGCPTLPASCAGGWASPQLRPAELRSFWQVRYYDFPVWSEKKNMEKVRYIHNNPVRRGLVSHPEEWKWSSFRQWATGVEGRVEVECSWTARRRERAGVMLTFVETHPPAKTAGRVGQPQ